MTAVIRKVWPKGLMLVVSTAGPLGVVLFRSSHERTLAIWYACCGEGGISRDLHAGSASRMMEGREQVWPDVPFQGRFVLIV